MQRFGPVLLFAKLFCEDRVYCALEWFIRNNTLFDSLHVCVADLRQDLDSKMCPISVDQNQIFS